MARITFILIVVLLFCGCEKYQYNRQPGKGLEFHYITELKREKGSSKIINSSVRISDSVIIYYDEILSYDPDNYTFKITTDLAERMSDFRECKLHGTAFAVTIDQELIYTGYFWASFSSSSVDWVTIDPLMAGFNNELKVQLGYPGFIIGDYIPDNRNDKRIIDLLREDGKI